ncbi:glycosyltransferase family 4 protein [Sulfurisphaera ohwakuensis]|uniref:Glycosyltransferase n=1 Tax=Sulfurisphaera ohwakuensis TaxID=69656 RepID=A0A650CJ64_SULOH|nr:glycosyltransferase [Sulfurisphaera ohwakuensis]MBB5253519.1 glycosyltransferase involved in cell wall biosynthesis [Sulfurisphaera ohwakuensis]QGR17823.1 glycosyltransferase [Sulfurisphaera ohwakuensis]
MNLGIIYDNLLSPTFAGGGAVHSFEVITRLKKYYKIIYYPSTLVFRWKIEDIERKAKELEIMGIKIADEFYTFLENRRKPKELLRYYDVNNIDLLYEPDHRSPEIFYLGKRTKKFGLTLHEPLFYDDSLTYLKRLIKFYGINPYTGKGFHTRFLYNELYAKPLYKRLIKKTNPTFIAAVSEGTLEISGLKGEVIKPGNAFDKELLDHRNKGKEDYIVFWSRLNQDKGIAELLDVVHMINKMSGKNFKLVVMGKFFDKFNERRFWRKVKKYSLNVDYLGFVERRKLYEIVSRAKLFIYPSHVDGFSLVVLESLALGTPVVAYDIPAIRTVYKGLNAVRIVREFDKESMAKESLSILSMSEGEIEGIMNEENLLNFLNLHSSWDNVAESVRRIIDKYTKE